ncbi:MAG: autotransporter outer membrane beta-barrel domain-containing protein [Oceanospirillales bacterium]|nr:autotransporter outer membrane beta-barrel domain-containing protein [Oceanospirillales bacterium]
MIDSSSDLQALFGGFSSEGEISAAVSQTLPVLTGAGSMAARTTLYGINNAVGARQRANLGLSSGDAMLSDKHFWIKPFGTWTEQDDRKGVSGYDAKTGGLVLGLDSSINDLTRLGLAFAYANTNVDSNSSVAPQSLDIDSYQLIGYGSYALDANTDLTFQADFGQNQNQGKRVITFTNSAADSDYDSYTAHLGAGVAHTYAINDANRAIATVKADYTWIKDESYTESGAGLLNLDVESNTTEALVAGVEGQLIHTLNPSTELNAKLGVGYDLINDQASITSSFAGAPGAQFTTEGLDPNPWIANAGFGMFHTADNGAEISANYDAEYRSDYLSQTASLKLRVAF